MPIGPAGHRFDAVEGGVCGTKTTIQRPNLGQNVTICRWLHRDLLDALGARYPWRAIRGSRSLAYPIVPATDNQDHINQAADPRRSIPTHRRDE